MIPWLHGGTRCGGGARSDKMALSGYAHVRRRQHEEKNHAAAAIGVELHPYRH
jgi:hypothetical protein